MEEIPRELFAFILSFLCPKQVFTCRLVCKGWNKLLVSKSAADALWESISKEYPGGAKPSSRRYRFKSYFAFIVKELKEYQSLLNAPPHSDFEPFENVFRWAVARGHHAIVAKLLRESKITLGMIEGKYSNRLRARQRPLLMAVRGGHTRVVQLLISAGVSVYRPAHAGTMTAFHLAAQSGHSEVLELLLSAAVCAKVPARPWSGMWLEGLHPSWIAALLGDLKLVKKYLDDDCKCGLSREELLADYGPSNLSILECAAYGGHVPLFQWLLERGATASKDAPLLLQGIRSGNIEMLRLLLDQGYKINTSAPQGEVQIAWQQGRLDMLELLISRETPKLVLNAARGYDTILHDAIRRADVAKVTYLLDLGADPNGGGDLSSSSVPMHELWRYRWGGISERILERKTKILTLLLDHGASVAWGNLSENCLTKCLFAWQFISAPYVLRAMNLLISHGANTAVQGLVKLAFSCYDTEILDFVLGLTDLDLPSDVVHKCLETEEFSTSKLPKLDKKIQILLSALDRRGLISATLLHQRAIDGVTPLHLISLQNFAILQRFLDYYPDLINSRDKQGVHPFVVACSRAMSGYFGSRVPPENFEEIVEAWRSLGARLTSRDIKQLSSFPGLQHPDAMEMVQQQLLVDGHMSSNGRSPQEEGTNESKDPTKARRMHFL